MPQTAQQVEGFCTMELHSTSSRQANRTVVVLDIKSGDPQALEILTRVANGLDSVAYPCINRTKSQLELTVRTPSSQPFVPELFLSIFAQAVRSEVRWGNRKNRKAGHLVAGQRLFSH